MPGQASPVQIHPYRIAPAWREELRKEIFKLKEEGIITYSQSPWSAPMVPVRKSNGSIRLCIDFRALNEVMVPDPYQMQDWLGKVSEATWFSKLDMNRGFYQVPLEASSQPKSAFCSPWGKFHFTRMPFGLRNAPASFQRCMDSALGHLLASTCRGVARIFLKGVLSLVSLARLFLQLVRCIVLASLATLSAFSLET